MAGNSSFGIALRQFIALTGAPGQTELSDLALVHKFVAECNESALATLLRRHGPMVYGVGRRVLRHSEDAEDVFQAAFLLLARKAAGIRKGESVGSWLHGVSYHLAIRLAAQRTGRKRHEREAAAMHSRENGNASSLPELEKALDEALQQLPEIYRQALVVCYLEGKSHEEAARILGCPVATLRSRLARGRQRLHSILTCKGVSLSAAALGGALSINAADAAKMLPPLRTTLEASLQFAAGKGAEAVTSTSVASLVEGGLKALFAAKIKIGVAVLLGIGILAGSAGTMGSWVFANSSSADTRPEKRSPVAQVQPMPKKTLTDIYGDKLPPGAVKRLGTVRFRHGQHIESVAYSPDGKWIASGADDHTVRIWDRATGKELLRFDGHSDDVHFVAFTPDGKYIISSSGWHTHGRPGAQDPCTLKWEAATGKFVGRMPANRWNLPMAALALSPDGTTLAACLTPELYISDVTNGRLLRTFAAEDGIVMKMSFSPDGHHLAMIADGHGVSLIDVGTGKQIWLNNVLRKDPFRVEPTVYGVAFSPDGRRLAVCVSREGPARVLDSATGDEICRFDNRNGPLVFSRDGKQVIGAIGIWDAATGEKVRDLNPKVIWNYELALSPDGKQLVDAGSSALQFWDIATGKGITQPAASLGLISQIQLAPDLKSMVTFSMFDPEDGVRLWDLQTCRQVSAFPGAMHNPVALSPALDLLAYGTYGEGEVSLRQVSEWATKHSLPGFAVGLTTLTFTRDGQRLIATTNGNPGEAKSAFNGGPILMWDVKTGKAPITLGSLAITKGSGARCATISPDDKFLASGGWDNIIRLWDIAGRKEVRQFVGQEGNICAVCFSPDGKYVTAVSGVAAPTKTGLFSNSKDNHLRIWEVATGRVVRMIEGPVEGSWSVAWSPDGATIASGGEDGLVRLWEAGTGRQRTCLTGHDGPVTSLSFTPDGRQLFSGSADTTVLVWDLAGLPSQRK